MNAATTHHRSSRSPSLDALYREITAAVESRAHHPLRTGSPWDKNPDFRSYGLSTPELRDLIRTFRRHLVALPLDRRLRLAEHLYRPAVAELASVATGILAASRDDLDPAHFPILDRCLDHFHSWGTTDDFSINVLQPLLLRHPAATVRLLRRWNRSLNRWKRRASVVAFTRKIGASGRFADETVRLCDRLIGDPDDLVQKGVGWALKDNLRGARGKVYHYVRHLRAIGAPATITLYAMRDLKGTDRAALLRIKPR